MSELATPEFFEECLKHHNSYRAVHNSPPLTLSDELNSHAQEWADDLATRDAFEHRTGHDYGENLYVGFNSDPEWKLEAKDAVKSWYDEIADYTFGESAPNNSSEVGHFTQVVWKGSEKLGVGIAASETGKIYVVCNYEPAGNMVGDYPENVLPADKSKQDFDITQYGERYNLSPSEEKLGIKISPRDPRLLEGVEKLHAVPSEKLRVWSSWLVLVTDVALDEWLKWIRSHINFALRLQEKLLKAHQGIELEKQEEEERRKKAEERKNVKRESKNVDTKDFVKYLAADPDELEGIIPTKYKICFEKKEEEEEKPDTFVPWKYTCPEEEEDKKSVTTQEETKQSEDEATQSEETPDEEKAGVEAESGEEIPAEEGEPGEKGEEETPEGETAEGETAEGEIPEGEEGESEENPDEETPDGEAPEPAEDGEEGAPEEDAPEPEEAPAPEEPAEEAPELEEEFAPDIPEEETPEPEEESAPEVPEDAPPEAEEAEGAEPSEEAATDGEESDMPKSIENLAADNSRWPIGIPWVPVKRKKKVRKEPEEKVEEIPIPTNEKDMTKLFKKIRHDTTIYRSLYKHWTETGKRANREIVGRTILPTDEVHTHEDTPYFFYLRVDPDIDIGMDHDDEEILLPDEGLEWITCNFVRLYFNLNDKPGGGGKPWL